LPPKVRWDKWKWNALEKYFYVSQVFSGERCGPWASCFFHVDCVRFVLAFNLIWHALCNKICNSFWFKSNHLRCYVRCSHVREAPQLFYTGGVL
jgi:hypothetical protein